MSFAVITLLRLASRRLATGARIAVVAALVLGAPAQAATYYVSPTGIDTNAGTSLGTAWRTIAKANQTLVAGDNVLIQPGTYTDGIVPAASGTSGSRITYVGTLVGRGLVSVASIDLTGRSYVSAKGVTSRGSLAVSGGSGGVAAQYDTVSYVTVLGSAVVNGAYRCYFANDSIGTGDYGDNFSVASSTSGSRTQYTKFVDCDFNLASSRQPHSFQTTQMLNSEFTRCRFRLAVVAGTYDVAEPSIHYRARDNTWTDCKFTIKNLFIPGANLNERYALNLRDSSRFNAFVRDTFFVDPTSTGAVKLQFAVAGAYNDWNGVSNIGSCAYNSWRNCFIRLDGIVGMQTTGSHGYNFTGNTFILKSAFRPAGFSSVDPPTDSLTFRHNTVISTTNSAFSTYGQGLTRSTLRSNIFYATGANAAGTVEISNESTYANSSDSNLVYATGQTEAGAFGVRPSGTTSAPGPGHVLCDTYGKDCHSLWGDPQLTNVSWATADPTPRAGSIALSSGLWTDGYVGAINPGTSVGDLIPPAAVGDLVLALISDHTIVMRWTATGDDGTTGQASAYDLRWSNQPITAANFAAATPVAIQPVPDVAGTPQSYVLTDLTLSTNYYFALRVVDRSGNWSSLSNVLAATTKATDTVPPAPTTLGP